MKMILSLTLLMVLSIAYNNNAAAQCDSCPTPRVAINEFENTVPEPPRGSPEFGEWLASFSLPKLASSEIFNDDTSCIRFLDSADFQDTGAIPSQRPIVVGMNDPQLVPTVVLGGMNYLFTSNLRKIGRGFEMTMAVEGACSRESLLSATTTFATVEEGKEVAKTVARSQFTPLGRLLREAEKRLRDSDTRVAICALGDENLVIKPAKNKAKPFETVRVDFTLIDCDGAALPNRTIHLAPRAERSFHASHNGNYDVASVTTDSAGKASASFTLGGGPDVAIPRAHFEYLLPSGCDQFTASEAFIVIDGSAIVDGSSAHYYKVQFTYEEYKHEKFASELLFPGGAEVQWRDIHEDLFMSCSGLWKNDKYAQANGEIELSGSPAFGCNVLGEYDLLDRQEEQTTATQEDPYVFASHAASSRTHVTGVPTGDRSQLDLIVSLDPKAESDSAQFTIYVPFRFNSKITWRKLEHVEGEGGVMDTPDNSEWDETSEKSIGPEPTEIYFASREFFTEINGKLDIVENGPEYSIQRHGILKAKIAPVN